MSSIESVLSTRLSLLPGLVALIGNRFYRNIAPQGVTVPFITYRRVSSYRQSGMGTDIGIVNARYQFDVIASTYERSREIIEELRLGLQRWRSPSTSPEVLETYIDNDFDSFDDDTDLFHGIFECSLFYRES